MTDKLPPKIFILEKDDALRASLCNTIERYWFNVLKAADPETASRIIAINKPNAVIISTRDLRSSPIEIINRIRKLDHCESMPFILITEENEPIQQYKDMDSELLELISRPFTPNEVMIAIKSLLRRSRPVFEDKIIKYKDLSMDLATFKVIRGTKQIHLGPTEFKILQLLVLSPKVIFTRPQIVDYVWGIDEVVEPRTVDVHINRLRSLIKLNNHELPFIKTIRSSGYCLNLPGEID